MQPSHIIKNFDALATTSLRKDILEVLEAGYNAINTKNVIRNHIKLEKDILTIKDEQVSLEGYERIFVVGIGKCALDGTQELENILGDKITGGIVIDVREGKLKRIKTFVGTHPFPSQKNVKASQAVFDLAEGLGEKDLVIALISGGGSALLYLPLDINGDVLVRITKLLQKKGATIQEINTVRKHLDKLKGGQLSKLAYPAKVVSLIFSDVPGNDVGMVASGPTVLDNTTKQDAQKVLKKYDILDECRASNCKLLETPKEEKYFKKVQNILLLTNEAALSAMADRARNLGYYPFVYSTNFEGEARELGKKFAQMEHKSKSCFIAGGESTVTVLGKGKGGRNQELALSALDFMKKGAILAAATSDGWDNTDAAGAIADTNILEQAKKYGLDPQKYLTENNSYEFFKKVGGHIITGLTGSNVSDFVVIMRG